MSTLTLASVLANAQRRKQKSARQRFLSQRFPFRRLVVERLHGSRLSVRGLVEQLLAEARQLSLPRSNAEATRAFPLDRPESRASTLLGRIASPVVQPILAGGRVAASSTNSALPVSAQGRGLQRLNSDRALPGSGKAAAVCTQAWPRLAPQPFRLAPDNNRSTRGSDAPAEDGSSPRSERKSALAAVLSEGTTVLAFLLFLGGALLI